MTLSDEINRAIEVALTGAKITSASPGHVNTVFLLEEMDHTNFEDGIRDIVDEQLNLFESTTLQKSDQLTSGKTDAPNALELEIKKVNDEMENLTKSPLGELANLTREQTANLAQFSKDPFQFMIGRFFKRFAKGAGIILLATIIFAAVQLIITELMKAGRLLDRRFKRIARDEILLFNSREEVAELRQGFRTVTITTMPFLSGAEVRGQISGNLYNPSAIPMNRLDSRRVISPIISAQNSSRGSKFERRRNRR